MSKVKLELGVELETTGPGEFEKILRNAQVEAEERERAHARGIQWKRFRLVGNVASTAVTLGGGQQIVGPRADQLWQMRRVVVNGLSTNDTVGLYINDVQDATQWDWLFGGTFAQFTFSKAQLTLSPGDRLVFQNIGALTATGTICAHGEYVELPMVMQGKML